MTNSAADGAAKSNMRLQLGTLKRKAKDLEEQVREKDLEVAKMREKTSDKAQEGLKDELKRAYDVLRHLKKKVGPHAFNEEYGVVMNEIREALGMPPVEKKNKKKKALALAEARRRSESQKAQEEDILPMPQSDEDGEEDDRAIDAGDGLISSDGADAMEAKDLGSEKVDSTHEGEVD